MRADRAGHADWRSPRTPNPRTSSNTPPPHPTPAPLPPSLPPQTKRALHFLDDLFRLVEERVVFVVTHSGFTRSVLLAVGREPYRWVRG